MPTDPMYTAINEGRRRKRRWWLSVALLLAGGALLVAAFVRHSILLAVLGVATLAIASQTPISRQKNNS